MTDIQKVTREVFQTSDGKEFELDKELMAKQHQAKLDFIEKTENQQLYGHCAECQECIPFDNLWLFILENKETIQNIYELWGSVDAHRF